MRRLLQSSRLLYPRPSPMITTLYKAPSMQPKTPVSLAPVVSKQVSMTAQQLVNTRNSPASLSSPLPKNESFLWGTYVKNQQRASNANAGAPTLDRSYSNASTVSVISSDAGSTTTSSSFTAEPGKHPQSATPTQSTNFISAPAVNPDAAPTSPIAHFKSDSALLSKTMVLEHSIDHPLHAVTQQKIRNAITQQDFRALDEITLETPITIEAIATYKATLKTAQAITNCHPTNTAIEMLSVFYNAKPPQEEAAFIDVVRKAAIAQQLTIAYESSTKL